MSRVLFNFVKSKIPKISSTELIALRSGNTSLDRTILEGYLKFPQKKKLTNKFSEHKLNDLLNSYDGSRVYPNNNSDYWIKYSAKNKFFSFRISRIQRKINLII